MADYQIKVDAAWPEIDRRKPDVFKRRILPRRLSGRLMWFGHAVLIVAAGLFFIAADRPASVNFLDEYSCSQSGEWDGRELCEIWELRRLDHTNG